MNQPLDPAELERLAGLADPSRPAAKKPASSKNHRDSRDSRDGPCFERENSRPTHDGTLGQVGREPLPEAPEGWSLTHQLVYEVKEGKPDEAPSYLPICGPLWVIARTLGAHGEWGIVTQFVDHDERLHRFALPAGRLHEDPSVLCRELATMGLRVVPGKERRLLAYLDAWTTDARIPSARRLGWQDRPDGALVYILPDRAITADGGSSEIVYSPERFSPTTKTVHAGGTLAEWRARVATPAARCRMTRFALAAGMAPPFLAFAEASDSFVVHLWGQTSRGKTTLGQVAASHWGCAADPNDAPSLTFVRRWNMTGNGLEALSEAHSDLPLVLDELGASTASDIRPMVYALAGGQGKTAMNSARELKEPRAWRTIAISTGEGSLTARMSETAPVKGGLIHRALDVEVQDIAEGVPAGEREALVEGIKAGAARHYGHSGPLLIETMAREFGTAAAARAYLKGQMGLIFESFGFPDLPTETRRALKRFALIAAAGEFGARNDIIPCTPAEVRSCVRTVAEAWLSLNAETDDLRIIAAVRAFLHRHAARFQPLGDPPATNDDMPTPARLVLDRAGWVDHRTGERWLLPHALAEAAPGHDAVTVARALKKAGHLRTDKGDGRMTARVTVEGGSRPRVYAVLKSILVEEPLAEVSV